MIKGGKVFIQGAFQEIDIGLDGDTIKTLEKGLTGDVLIDATGLLVVPGFIDVHIHGYNMMDTMQGKAAVMGMARSLPKHGVTAFLPTTMCHTLERTREALEGVAEAMAAPQEGAAIVGCHMEGPYVNVEAKAAQPEWGIFPPSVDGYEKLVKDLPDMVRLMTIAPEVDGMDALIEHLVAKGVALTAGHTTASYEQHQCAVGMGVRQLTHAFNGMPGMHHRMPGTIGSALLDERVLAQAICDGIHLAPPIIALLYRLKGAKGMLLITDAMMATGAGDGDYTLGDGAVHVKDGIARLAAGNLAGSTLTMDQAVRNAVSYGVKLEDALTMASQTPARSIGLARRGEIQVGHFADLALLTQNLDVVYTIAAGKIMYHKEKDGR